MARLKGSNRHFDDLEEVEVIEMNSERLVIENDLNFIVIHKVISSSV